MKRTEPNFIELDEAQLQEALQLAQGLLPKNVYELFKTIIESYIYLVQLLACKSTTIRRLRKWLFGARTEKTSIVLGEGADSQAPSASAPEDRAESAHETNPDQEPPKRRKGHGRNGADAYPGAETISVPHPSLQAGDACPDCQEGTVYQVARPGVLVRIVGQAPVQAKVYQLQKLRCNLCGNVFTAPSPQDAGPQKYDATVGSMIGLLKYGSGMPFNRLQGLQGGFGIPLPASTQWDIVAAKAKVLAPAHQELIRQAAQGDVLHNDDTSIRILEFMGKRAQQAALSEDSSQDSSSKKASERTGLFTSGIVSTRKGRRIVLFFTGRKHAGENLRDVLDQRAQDLERPIQMSDALSRNMPAELQTILANCLAHGRRQFVDVVELFPEECRYVLEALKVVYKNDAEARQQNLSPEARLHFHQTHSRSVMEELHTWLNHQIDDRLVEPNSALGQSISYMLKHWQKLTLFLRQAGAPLDNNLCERVLKKVILHRKNAYFYKTQNGADVADLYMSLIHTCELNTVNPFDYLTELERHANELADNPPNWMPWNYRITLAGLASTAAPGVDTVDGSLAVPATDAAGRS